MCGYLSRPAVGWARSLAVSLNIEKSNFEYKSEVRESGVDK